MKRLTISFVLLAAFLASVPISSAQGAAPADGYVVHRSIPLQLDTDGVAGRLEILEDSRITPELRSAMWGHTKDPSLALDYDDPLAQEFRRKPLLPGRLRLFHAAGFVTFEELFDVPLGEIEAVTLYSTKKRTFLVTTDYSVGFGSYAGPITGFAEIRDGDLSWLEAVDEDGGEPQGISLMRSLKRGWKLVDAAGGKEIQKIGCEIDLAGDGNGFKTEYGVFSFDGETWRYRERTEPGCSELGAGPDESWPERSVFP